MRINLIFLLAIPKSLALLGASFRQVVVGGGNIPFLSSCSQYRRGPTPGRFLLTMKHRRLSEDSNAETNNRPSSDQQVVGVVAPLHYEGPYPILKLRFPHLVNDSKQQEHQDDPTGVVLNFVLDTGANVNTVDTQRVVEKYHLEPFVQNMAVTISAGMGGLLDTGGVSKDLYSVGDCELEGLPPPSRTFLHNLTAASISHTSPVGEGLLGQMFFSLFAAVEFDWVGTDGDPPTVIFYFVTPPPDSTAGMTTSVPIQRWVGLIAVNVTLNGVEMVACLDTGSPVTIVHPRAAQQAGINIQPQTGVVAGGVDGRPIHLSLSDSPVNVTVGSCVLGQRRVLVGELPGLTLASQVFKDEGAAPPTVLLGLDFLRRTYRTILEQDRLWLQLMPDDQSEADIIEQ